MPSQNNEDSILSGILNHIGTTNKVAVEFGVGPDGKQCNTQNLMKQGWNVIQFDIASTVPTVYRENITVENVCNIFTKYLVPNGVDVLSIDVDGNDYHIWKALDNYHPRVVIIEYNSTVGPDVEWVMPYNKDHKWDGTNYHGASFKSLVKLGNQKGYSLVACDKNGVNMFFVRNDVLFKPPGYKYRTSNKFNDNKEVKQDE